MASPTELFLPATFPYPIKVTSIDVSKDIQRGTRLLSYSFVHVSPVHGAQPETRFGTWDSAIEGSINKWNIQPGDVVSRKKAKDKPALLVIEPCKHGMQLGGLCVLCGKDMTNFDYTGFSDASRASIQMTHSANGPTVSLEEAQRIERETADHLLKSRKLSLIVDLDQTIVHATVDPTVGEWISEGEMWESRHASSSKVDPEDECNPNWDALKDVKRFRLGPESFGSSKGKGKAKSIENEGCIYYIKPRPGWTKFLADMSTKYEMHVYTMGTRAYAEEVCAAIDPDGKAFGGRILSRDESGSLTQKSLQRLFPCDTSMVVIIDDRADVWEWSPNLIKVIPYDFFIGIGDINSSFLPKLEPLGPTVPSQAPSSSPTIPSPSPPPSTTEPSDEITADSTDIPVPPTPQETERVESATKEMLTQNSRALEAQLEERPLAKRQEALQSDEAAGKHPADTSSSTAVGEATHSGTDDTHEAKEADPAVIKEPEKPVRKALLKNDDVELDRISQLLDEVHERFFTSYENRSSSGSKPRQRRPTLSGGKRGEPHKPYDVTRIIPAIRSEVLEGVHILFSSVIPLDTRPESTEIWRMAHMFGAKCSTDLTSEVTHVVAAKRGTVKVDTARKRGGYKIVWLAWFTDSVALWRHLDETPYLLDDPPLPITSPTVQARKLSGSDFLDGEDDEEDWDLESGSGSAGALPSGGLELNDLDWADINAEVDAAMEESDDGDEDEGSIRGDAYAGSDGSGMRSEDDMSDTGSVISNITNGKTTPPSSPKPGLKRKRLRSVTPGGLSTALPSVAGGDEDALRSPLSKRKKLAAERTGASKLKEGLIAEDIVQESTEDDDVASVKTRSEGKAATTEDGEESELEDDFLANALGEEWG